MKKYYRFFIVLAATAVLLSPAVFAGDLLLRGGTVVTAAGPQSASVRIRGEKILAVGELDVEPSDERVIDVTGMLILPGGIDPHVHLAPATAAFPFVDDSTAAHARHWPVGSRPLATWRFRTPANCRSRPYPENVN